MSFGNVFLRFALLVALFGAMVSCRRGPESDSPGDVDSSSTGLSDTSQLSSVVTATLPATSPTSEPSDGPEELQAVSLVLTNGIVIAATGADPIANGLVAIQGNRIVAVGPSADFKIPSEADVIDAAGGTIMPGVINAHTHGVGAAGNRRLYWLLDGVTTVCDLAIPLKDMQKFDQEEIEAGPAARGFTAGSIVTAPGGYPGSYQGFAYNYEIRGVHEAENAVRNLHARGADYIKVALEPSFAGKVLPVMNLEELRSVVVTAHANDLLVRAHVTKSDLLDMALDADVDVVEHVPMPSD